MAGCARVHSKAAHPAPERALAGQQTRQGRTCRASASAWGEPRMMACPLGSTGRACQARASCPAGRNMDRGTRRMASSTGAGMDTVPRSAVTSPLTLPCAPGVAGQQSQLVSGHRC